MTPIEGVDLAAETKAAEAEVLEGHRRKVRSAVAGIVADLVRFNDELREAEAMVAKTKSKIEAGQAKYRRLIEGDWSVLNENMLKSQPSSERS